MPLAPAGRGEAMAITSQEAWVSRQDGGPAVELPTFVAEVVEVPCDGTGYADDVDTLEDLGNLQEDQ